MANASSCSDERLSGELVPFCLSFPLGDCLQQHFSLSVSQMGKFLGCAVRTPTAHAVTRKFVLVQEPVAKTLNRR